MPYAGDRSARLFYDDACGPCRLLARATEQVSRHRVVATPLTSPVANVRLDGVPPEARYGYAHLDAVGGLRTGEAITAPLVGLTLGPTWEGVVRKVPPLDRAMRRAYLWFWEYRRTRGCAAAQVD
jgi:hypothetical protein